MRKVQREELVDYATWQDDVRPGVKAEVMHAKQLRRVHLAPYLTFLFENALTIRWQIQEMMRVERIVKESAIVHELETYNGLLGDPGELGCTLLIEIDDRAERDRLLPAWRGLLSQLYLEVEGGERLAPTYDPAQVGDERLSSVQYLRFPCPLPPVALGSTFEGHPGRVELSEETRAALQADLAD